MQAKGCMDCWIRHREFVPAHREEDGEPLCARHYKERTAPVESKPTEVVLARDCRDLVGVLSKCLLGVIDKQIDPSQANAICNLVNTAIRVLETEHRMKGVKP